MTYLTDSKYTKSGRLRKRNPWKTMIWKAKCNARPGHLKGNGAARKEYLPVTIDWIYLQNQWFKQDGKCYWSGYPIDPQGIYERNNPLAMSLERRDDALGYVPGNVVLALRLFNLGRQTTPEDIFVNQVQSLREHFEGKQIKSSLREFIAFDPDDSNEKLKKQY